MYPPLCVTWHHILKVLFSGYKVSGINFVSITFKNIYHEKYIPLFIFFAFRFTFYGNGFTNQRKHSSEKGTGNLIEFAIAILLREGTVTVSYVLTESNGHFRYPVIGAGKYSL